MAGRHKQLGEGVAHNPALARSRMDSSGPGTAPSAVSGTLPAFAKAAIGLGIFIKAKHTAPCTRSRAA